MRRLLRLFLTILVASLLPQGNVLAADAASVSQDIRAALSANNGRGEFAADLRRVYEAGGFQPVWVLSPGASERAAALAQLPGFAARQGLEPGRYLARVPSAHAEAARIAVEDIAATQALLRFAHDLRSGAVAASSMGPDWSIQPDAFDAAGAVVSATNHAGLDGFVAALPPPSAGYRRLVQSLAEYEAIAARGGWPVVPGEAELIPGAGDSRETALRERLRIEGDLQTQDDDAESLRAAVRRFQARHGLTQDGRIGRATLRAMQVDTAGRVGQIRANLERWRHLPRDLGARRVEVNAADQSAELHNADGTTLTMRAVVGDLRHPTPVLSARILAITLNPPWNVPVSIATKEFLPKLRRDPGYLAAHEIVIVNKDGDPFGRDIDWKSVGGRGFPYVLRQNPGPRNSLGVIKLEMPNPFDVYLHDTPAKALFARSPRYFSHGCVRLERAADMAIALIADESAWNRASLADAIRTGATRRIDLGRPVPVYILYWTAFVSEDGQVNFRDDAYGRDGPLLAALSSAAAMTADSRAQPGGCPPG